MKEKKVAEKTPQEKHAEVLAKWEKVKHNNPSILSDNIEISVVELIEAIQAKKK